MASTYYITGVQIGMIFGLLDFGKRKDVRDILQKILDTQLTTEDARSKNG